jgi:anti-sigma B factor antagonist
VDLDIRENGSICLLKLKGPLRYRDGVDDFGRAVENTLATGHLQVLVDLSAVSYIDSSGIGAVVDALRQSKRSGGTVKLIDPSPFVAKMLKMVSILNLFEVYPNEAEAMHSCAT